MHVEGGAGTILQGCLCELTEVDRGREGLPSVGRGRHHGLGGCILDIGDVEAPADVDDVLSPMMAVDRDRRERLVVFDACARLTPGILDDRGRPGVPRSVERASSTLMLAARE